VLAAWDAEVVPLPGRGTPAQEPAAHGSLRSHRGQATAP
jgi:hypothetical protein